MALGWLLVKALISLGVLVDIGLVLLDYALMWVALSDLAFDWDPGCSLFEVLCPLIQDMTLEVGQVSEDSPSDILRTRF